MLFPRRCGFLWSHEQILVLFYFIWQPFYIVEEDPWRKWLDACLPLLGSQVCIFVSPCGFCGGRNEVWVGFSQGFSHFPCHKFHSTISPLSSHSLSFISYTPVMVHQGSGMVGWHSCYSQTFNIGVSLHLIPWPGSVLDTSWGFIYSLMTKKIKT